MPYFYSDPTCETDPHALPNVEVFEEPNAYSDLDSGCVVFPDDDPNAREEIERRPDAFAHAPGFYYAFGFPGCLWDGDPVGPFSSEEAALADAREGDDFGEYDDGLD